MMTIPIGTSIRLQRKAKIPAPSPSIASTPTMRVPTTVPTRSTTDLADRRQMVPKAACALSIRLAVRGREPQSPLPASETSQQVQAECVSINKGQREKQRMLHLGWYNALCCGWWHHVIQRHRPPSGSVNTFPNTVGGSRNEVMAGRQHSRTLALKIQPGRLRIELMMEILVILITGHAHLNGCDDNVYF